MKKLLFIFVLVAFVLSACVTPQCPAENVVMFIEVGPMIVPVIIETGFFDPEHKGKHYITEDEYKKESQSESNNENI